MIAYLEFPNYRPDFKNTTSCSTRGRFSIIRSLRSYEPKQALKPAINERSFTSSFPYQDASVLIWTLIPYHSRWWNWCSSDVRKYFRKNHPYIYTCRAAQVNVKTVLQTVQTNSLQKLQNLLKIWVRKRNDWRITVTNCKITCQKSSPSVLGTIHYSLVTFHSAFWGLDLRS